MILPDGYSDVPAGKIAAVVTHLEMTERPALRREIDGEWTLRRVETPGLDWFRDLYRRIGEQWLWFSRLRMSDVELAAMIQSPHVEMYALVQDGRDEGVLELDRSVRTSPVRCDRKTGRWRRRALADESCAGTGLVAPGSARLGAHLQLRSSRSTSFLSALGFLRVPAADRNRGRSAA
jgi:hypothetical protein